MLGFLFAWLSASWMMILSSAPWLLLGFLVAGFVNVSVPKKFIKKHLSEPGLKSVLKASAIGVPLPLCSCSVVPVGVSLHRSGASRGATTSFFVSTPEIGIDSAILSFGILGPMISILRIVAAFCSAVIAGCLVDLPWFGNQSHPSKPKSSPEQEQVSSHPCCSEVGNDEVTPRRNFFETLEKSFRFGFLTLSKDLSLTLGFAFILGGLVQVLVPPDLIPVATKELGILLTLVVVFFCSLPLYVCASAATPLAAVLLSKGLTPGAVLVFLLAGPASNIGTVVALFREFGRGATFAYISGIASVTFIIAAGVDFYSNWVGLNWQGLVPPLHLHHELSTNSLQSVFGLICAICLTSLLVAGAWMRAKISLAQFQGKKNSCCCH